jgi:hypothetical protein
MSRLMLAPAPPSQRSLQSRYSVLVRHYGPDHPDTIAARRALTASQTFTQVSALRDTFPLLSEDQRTALVSLLLDSRFRDA